MKLKFLLYFICAFVLITSCKTKTDIVVPDTELEFVVTDEDENLLDSANVYLFDNRNTYSSSSSKNVSTGSIAKGITKNGIINFTGLSPDKDYFVHVSYKDSLSNLDTGFKIFNKLTKSSKTIAHIILTAAKLKVSFWTSKSDSIQLPLQIYINDVLAGSLESNRNSVPTNSNDDGVLSTPKIPGVYSYYAKSKNGCIWQGTFSIDADSNKFIRLEKCVSATISFWSGLGNNAKLPIRIIMDRQDTIGEIETGRINAPSDCGEEDAVTIALSPGTHTYHAISSDNQKLWTSTVNVLNEECKIIKLEDYQ